MKLPKTVQICGLDFEVIIDKNHDGAKFNLNQQKIWIGTKSGKDDKMWQDFCHETKEVVACLHGNRSDSSLDGEYSFHYNTHTAFGLAAAAEAAALFPLIQKGGKDGKR